ncbi:MAG: alpha/beta fold hydrolase [Cyclobacteriaceae bacterium]|nr:alpha/beta fold hydrolase [Cyclobacteriaceae bacterium]
MLQIKEENGFSYLEAGEGEPLVLLHGLLGALSNWESVVNGFSSRYKILIPVLPIFTLPVREVGLEKLTDFLEAFLQHKNITELNLMGNSLGGHIALIYTLRNQSSVKRLILTGSSGLFENSMGGSYPKRGSYEYVKERVAYTFYDSNTATEELVEDVFETTKSIPKCLKIVAIAKSAQRHNMANDISNIHVPTLLIWGLNDTITPPMVAHEFNRLLPNSTLRFIDECCHAPMMERPEKFNAILHEFLQRPLST